MEMKWKVITLLVPEMNKMKKSKINMVDSEQYKYKLYKLLNEMPYHKYRITCRQLPVVLGISRETFRKWKYIRKEDKATIPADKLAIIANFFEIRFEKLFNYSVPQVSFEELEEADRTNKNQNL